MTPRNPINALHEFLEGISLKIKFRHSEFYECPEDPNHLNYPLRAYVPTILRAPAIPRGHSRKNYINDLCAEHDEREEALRALLRTAKSLRDYAIRVSDRDKRERELKARKTEKQSYEAIRDLLLEISERDLTFDSWHEAGDGRFVDGELVLFWVKRQLYQVESLPFEAVQTGDQEITIIEQDPERRVSKYRAIFIRDLIGLFAALKIATSTADLVRTVRWIFVECPETPDIDEKSLRKYIEEDEELFALAKSLRTR